VRLCLGGVGVLLAFIACSGIAAAERPALVAAPPPTLGTNALSMTASPATYKLSLDGTAERARPARSLDTTMSPSGRFRYDATGGLSLIDLRTGARRRLTGTWYAQHPAWSPKGLLAYTDRKDGLTRVIVLDPATGRSRVAASHVCGDLLPALWSPDGSLLAVAVSRPHSGCNGHDASSVVAIAKARGGPMRRISTQRSVPVTWTRDGSALLVAVYDPANGAAGGSSLLVDAKTGRARPVSGLLSTIGAGSWSAGRHFYAAFTIEAGRQALAILDGSLKHVVRTVPFVTQFAWAPRMQWIAVATQDGVSVVSATTGRTLSTIPAVTPYGLSVQSLAWSPDGRSITMIAAPAAGHD
jgi:hypothetical protein